MRALARDAELEPAPDAAAIDVSAELPRARFAAGPEQALEALRAHRGALLVDLDETLFLRNSTELFIDSAWPGVIALLVLRLLDWIKPWRYTGGECSRDNWRAGAVALLLPWTFWRWHRRVEQLAAEQTNRPLLDLLLRRTVAPVVITAGFLPIVRPLCRAMGLGDTRVIGCRLLRPADRRAGKLLLATRTLGAATIGEALALTDSADDLPLLAHCRRGLLTQWPDAQFIPALTRIYLPGQYISRVKHVGQRYIWRGILQEDFAFWVLASITLAASPLWHCLGLLLLLISFWAIYERGYVDNDITGARHEEHPKLSPQFHQAPVATPAVEPWLWAAGAGALGVLALWHPASPEPEDFATWAGVLVAVHGWYWFYNRVDKGTRVWLYSGLQVGRTAAFVALVPVAEIGVAALASHVFARWIPYYCHGSNRWLTEQFHLTRLLLFVWLTVLLAMATGLPSVVNWTGALVLAWNIFRARHELRAAWRNAHRIDRPAP